MLKGVLDHVMNRGLDAPVAAAEARVKQRLMERPTIDVRAIVHASDVPPDLSNKAERVLAALAGAIQIPEGKLRHDDLLGELVRVESHELDVGSAAAMKAHGLGSQIEVFWYEIVNRLDTITHSERVRQQVVDLVGRAPRGDDGYIELMRGLRLGRFLALFAPAVR